MLAVSGTVVNASVNMTRRVAATRESESDRAHVRFSDLLMCADLTNLRSTNRPNSKKNHGVDFGRHHHISFARDDIAGFEKT